MGTQRVRLIGGPNGSGKTRLINELLSQGVPLGSIVNADDIAQQLVQNGYIDFQSYKLQGITQELWENELLHNPELQSRVKQKLDGIPSITIRENILVYQTTRLDSYTSALIADFIRYQLVNQGVDFSFETVMSHAAKVHFLKFARERGYLIYVYYIATSESLINVERVKNRVSLGGHDVPQVLIEKRYLKSLANLKLAVDIADRAFVIDNSSEIPELLLEKKNQEEVVILAETVPCWFNSYYLDKI